MLAFHPTMEQRGRSGVAARFHIWFLPVTWLFLTVSIWSIVVVNHWRGDQTMGAVFASLAGLWLADLLPAPHSELAFVLATCAGGAPVLALVGLFQDLLHVPRRIVAVYLVLPLVSFACCYFLLGMRKEGAGIFFDLHLLLVHFCIGLYVVSVGSCGVYLLFWMCRRLLSIVRRSRCPKE